MDSRAQLWLLAAALLLVLECEAAVYSSRLIHRFSDEVKAVRISRNGAAAVVDKEWPERRSANYYRLLGRSDAERQRLKLTAQYQYLFPSGSSKTIGLGNDFGWLHYTWIDIGMPSISFLVALDAGSDLLWVPCNCEQCAPLSATHYSRLDRDLNEYSPSRSSTSKHVSCGHQLCELGPTCENSTQSCPYTAYYATDNTTSSGLLVEDILHLASGNGGGSAKYLRAPVIIGCGRKQSGSYLDGVAPDGLMGLGMSDISVPSFLAKAGYIRNSFSLCFNEDDSGRIFFGDPGLATQQTTSFLPLDGKYVTYIVGVESWCIGNSCLDQTRFNTLVDSGSSFTYLPDEAYAKVVEEFDRRVNATKSTFEESPWDHCYKSRSPQLPKIPSVMLKFASNNSLVIHEPIFVISGSQGVVGFCLAIHSLSGDLGIIGQNYMKGYRMAFDRENLKLGWSRSNCEDFSDGERLPVNNSSSPNSLPTTTEQQRSPSSAHAVAPAVAGRTLSKSSATSIRLNLSFWLPLLELLAPQLFLFHRLVCII